MTFRARLFLSIFIFSFLPLGYLFNMGDSLNPAFIYTAFAMLVFTLMGTLAGAVKVDKLVKDSETRAVHSEVELYSFKERVFDGVFSVDEKGTVRDINTAMAQFLHYDAEFLKGKCLWNYLKYSRGAPDETIMPRGQARCTLTMTGRVKTGGTVELLVDLYLRKSEGQFDGFRGCARPVDKALVVEKVRESLAIDIFRVIKSRFKNYLEEIEKAAAPGKTPDAVLAGLTHNTNQLLCKLAACFGPEVPLKWVPTLRPQEVNPRKLLDYLRLKYSYYVQTHSKQLKIECAGNVNSFYGDPDYLAELLTQLLENSLKYTSENGQIELMYHETEEERIFTVSDNGIGVSHADMARLFTPFFRADNQVNAGTEGLGLGLWTAQQIAHAHRGKIFAESELGKGMTVTFLIVKNAAGHEIKWID